MDSNYLYEKNSSRFYCISAVAKAQGDKKSFNDFFWFEEIF